MAISFVGSGAVGLSTSDVVFNFSSLVDAAGGTPTLQQNDIVVVSTGYRITNSVTWDKTPTGYTDAYATIFEDATGNDLSLKTTYKVMGATPDTSVTIPAASSRGATVIHVLRGVNTTTPLDVTPTTAGAPNAAGANPNPPSITPTTAGAWIYCVGSIATTTPAASITNSPDLSSTTNHFKGALTTSTVGAIGAGLKEDWTSGAFDAAAFAGGTSNSSGSWAAASLALRPAATAYTLTASSGSYAETGSAATLKRGLRVAATAGSYALAGSAATLKAARALAATAAVYVESGSAAALKAGRLLAGSAGAYVESGSAATFKYGRVLAASAGSYAESGSAVTFKYGRVMSASAGSYALSGSSATFAKGFYLTAAAGAYALTGSAAPITAARLLSAGAGSYAIAGASATFARGYRLAASPGSYALTGAASQFRRGLVLTITVGTYTLNGSTVTLTAGAAHGTLRAPPSRTAAVSAARRIAVAPGSVRTAKLERPARRTAI